MLGMKIFIISIQVSVAQLSYWFGCRAFWTTARSSFEISFKLSFLLWKSLSHNYFFTLNWVISYIPLIKVFALYIIGYLIWLYSITDNAHNKTCISVFYLSKPGVIWSMTERQFAVVKKSSNTIRSIIILSLW